MTTMQQQGQQEEAVHPFDLPKSEFEELLERDFNLAGIEEAQEEAKYASTLADHLSRSIWMARAIDRLRVLLNDDLMRLVVMPLQNTRLGFKTDRPNKNNTTPYALEEVREAVVEALIRGAFIVGNEFNIISKGCYLTKEFFQRKIREFPGLTDFVPLPGVPRTVNGGAVVPYTVNYKLNGQGVTISQEIPVKVNDMMGTDAVIGKSDRKMWASVYRILTGSEQSIPDGEVEGEASYAAPGLSTGNSRLAALENAQPNGNGNRTAAAGGANPQLAAPAAAAAPAPPVASEAPAPAATHTAKRTGGRPAPKAQHTEPAKPAENPQPVAAAAAPAQQAASEPAEQLPVEDARDPHVAEAQEFIDSKGVDQLKGWMLKMTDDLRRVGREAAGVTNMTEATEEQIRHAAYAMRLAQLKK